MDQESVENGSACVGEKEDIFEDEEQPSKKQKMEETFDDEGSTCLICCEVWTQTGDHRITSLRCGHLFGHKCILRWLRENKICPTCKANATKRDIRHIYANKLLALDTGELTRMQNELDDMKEKHQMVSMNLVDVSCKLMHANKQIEMYKEQLEKSKRITAANALPALRLKHINSFVVCPDSTSRVMDYIPSKSILFASQKSRNSLFPGFGARSYNAETFVPIRYTPLHSKEIRDLKFNQTPSTLLSVSQDKTFCITHPFSNDCITKQQCDDMLWSCCWDTGDSNIFYIGGQRGSVKVYDMRNVSATPLHTFSIQSDFSPVVSIVSIPAIAGSAMPLGGFIAAKLNTLWAYEKIGVDYKRHVLPIEGPIMSSCYDIVDNHLLVALRPNNKEPTARNVLVRLISESTEVSCQKIHTFSCGGGQRQLVRSCFMYRKTGNCIATPNKCNLQVWNAQTGFKMATTQAKGTIMDILPLNIDSSEHLVALTEENLEVFKLIDTPSN